LSNRKNIDTILKTVLVLALVALALNFYFSVWGLDLFIQNICRLEQGKKQAQLFGQEIGYISCFANETQIEPLKQSHSELLKAVNELGSTTADIFMLFYEASFSPWLSPASLLIS